MKEKTDKMDFIEIKHFCFALPKILSRKWKDKTQTEKKIFAQHIFDEQLLPKIFKGLLKLNN